VARLHAHPQSMGPKMDSLLYATYFGLLPAQPLRLALVDPTDRYLRAWKPVPSCLQFDSTTRAFPLLLPPSPSSNGRLLHHHGEAKSHSRGPTCSGRIKGLQEGGSPRGRQHSRQQKAHRQRLRRIKMRHWTAMSCKRSASHGGCKDRSRQGPHQVDALKNAK